MASERFQEVVQFRSLADGRGIRMPDNRNNNAQNRSRNTGIHVEDRCSAVIQDGRSSQPPFLSRWFFHSLAVQLWATFITSLCLGFAVCKMGANQHPCHRVVMSSMNEVC